MEYLIKVTILVSQRTISEHEYHFNQNGSKISQAKLLSLCWLLNSTLMSHGPEERDYDKKGYRLAWTLLFIALFIFLWIWIIGQNQNGLPT